METEKAKVKWTRKSAPRTKTGCLTCKYRRVKCDERKPTCSRCENFGVICDGYPKPRSKQPSAAGVSQREKPLPLAPKSVSAPVQITSESYSPVPVVQSRWRPIAVAKGASIPSEIQIMKFDDETEQRYFNLFREKTAMKIAPYFESETWGRLVLQACHVPSIKHTVIAIAALHQTAMTLDNLRRMSLDERGDFSDLGVHHQVAINQYTKAIRGLREDLASGRLDLRTILISCLVVGCFEGYHGNIPLAHTQIRTGITMLHEWKKAYGDKYILSWASPNTHVIEDDLVTTFGRLEISTGYAYTDEDETHQIRREQLSRHLREMPPVFDNLTHARVYLELIFRQMEHYLYVSAPWPDTYHQHKRVEERVAARLKIERMSNPLNYCPSPSDVGEQKPNETREQKKPYPAEVLQWDFSSVRSDPNLPPEIADSPDARELQLAELLRWNRSFQATMKLPDMKEATGSMMLQMHLNICFICVKTYLDDVMLPDQYTSEILEVVAISKKLLEAFRNGEATNFTLDFGLNIPLYICGMKCRVRSIRKDIIDLLLHQPRREGFWDSQLAAKVIMWIRDLEEEHAGGDFVPEWCRIRPSEVGFNMKNSNGEKATEDEFGREAELVCHQRISPDNFETRERRITVVW
ncbi:hypothetical protein DL98DRAFT_513063 [Cadophora sp. DSE1049]|nr:hypothetical protein DL98DRAFT_513063 [Cadophora sp. DSE1049]